MMPYRKRNWVVVITVAALLVIAAARSSWVPDGVGWALALMVLFMVGLVGVVRTAGNRQNPNDMRRLITQRATIAHQRFEAAMEKVTKLIKNKQQYKGEK